MSPIGLTWRRNPVSQETAFKAMKASITAGAVFWNAGEFYGTDDRNSMHLLNEYFSKCPEDANKIVLSVKGGLGTGGDLMPNGTEENIKRSIDNCLKLLDGKCKLDLFKPARIDHNVPVETTIAAIDKYVQAGKIGGIALSEVGEKTIRRAAKVAKISAVEVEFSLFSTDILTNGIAQACKELDIPVVAYSPISRGLLV
jgi:pyridoxine 4-dehydrogenase